MELSKQCVSLELSKRLKDLGVKQESLFKWVIDYPTEMKNYITSFEDEIPPGDKQISAFTVAELGELLPYQFDRQWLPIKDDDGTWHVWEREFGMYDKDGNEFQNEATEADARAKMLIYLLENHLLGDK